MQKNYSPQLIEFGLKIKRLREARSLTQQDLAGKCEIDIRSIQRIEKGEFGLGLHILFALAAAFEMSPSQLLRGIKVEPLSEN